MRFTLKIVGRRASFNQCPCMLHAGSFSGTQVRAPNSFNNLIDDQRSEESLPRGDSAVGVGGRAAVDALVAGADLADEQRHLAARRVEGRRVLGAIRHVVRVWNGRQFPISD